MGLDIDIFVKASSIFSPIIALLAGFIAWQQYKANKDKVRLDLCQRRYGLYKQIIDFLLQHIYGDELPPKLQYKVFDETCYEASFLFPDSVSLVILDIQRLVGDGHTLKKRIVRSENPPIDLDVIKAKNTDNDREIESQMKRLRSEISSVLSFKRF